MRRERRNHAIASARARGRASTRQRFLAAPVGRGLGRGRLAGWRRHATGCDGRGAASGEVRAVGPRAPILVSVGRLLASRPSGKKLALSRRPERAPSAENAAETFRGSSAPGRELRTIPDLSHSERNGARGRSPLIAESREPSLALVGNRSAAAAPSHLADDACCPACHLRRPHLCSSYAT